MEHSIHSEIGSEEYKGQQIQWIKVDKPPFRERERSTYYTARINGWFYPTMFSNLEYAQNKVRWSIDDGNYCQPYIPGQIHFGEDEFRN